MLFLSCENILESLEETDSGASFKNSDSKSSIYVIHHVNLYKILIRELERAFGRCSRGGSLILKWILKK
jgi:thiamine biosynthesis protein ThiC